MEKSISILSFLLLGIFHFSFGQEYPREFIYEEGDTTYTMKQYVFCLYTSGTERSQNAEESAELQKQHLAHLADLQENHNLQMAGPFGDDGSMRGILLFDLDSNQRAIELVEKDPMVINKRLEFECHPIWLAKGTVLR